MASQSDSLLDESEQSRIVTVFAPGSMCPRLQALIYTRQVIVTSSGDEEDGVELYRGERRSKWKDPELAFNVRPGPESPEMRVLNLPPPQVVHRYRVVSRLDSMFTLPAERDRNCRIGKRIDYMTDMFKLSLAGTENAKRVQTEIKQALRTLPERHKLVLYGVSRGASSLFVAVTKLAPAEQTRISLVVAEAPFDSVFAVSEALWGRPLAAAIECVRSCLTPDNVFTDTTPLEAAETFPSSVPVLIFSGGKDTVCPIGSQQKIVEALRRNGNEQVKHIVLPNSTHTDMPHGPDASTYRMQLRLAYRAMFS